MRPKFLFVTMIGAAIWGALALSAQGVAAQATKTHLDGVYTAEQVTKGEELYMVQCVECHIKDLTGGNPEMQPAPPLTGREFTEYWNNKGLDEMYEIIRLSMPKTDPGHLTEAQAVELVAFISARNGGKAGATPLPADAAALKAIKFKF